MTPLAEGRWLFRRLYVYALTLGLWLSLDGVIDAIRPVDLPTVADGLMGLLGLVLVLYLVAPTAQQMVQILADLKLRIGGRP